MRRLGHSLSYDDSIRILLEGLTGCNCALVGREAGTLRENVWAFIHKKYKTSDEIRDKIAEFVWFKMNAHLLICDEDKL